MRSLNQVLSRFFRDERGQGMIEYALILFLISIAAILILTPIGARLVAIFTQVLTALGG